MNHTFAGHAWVDCSADGRPVVNNVCRVVATDPPEEAFDCPPYGHGVSVYALQVEAGPFRDLANPSQTLDPQSLQQKHIASANALRVLMETVGTWSPVAATRALGHDTVARGSRVQIGLLDPTQGVAPMVSPLLLSRQHQAQRAREEAPGSAGETLSSSPQQQQSGPANYRGRNPHTAVTPQELVVAVWSHDLAATARANQAVHTLRMQQNAKQQPLTARQISDVPELKEAEEQARMEQARIADAVAESLTACLQPEHGLRFSVGRGLMQVALCSVRISPLGICFAFDCNVSPEKCVFHSPMRGSTLVVDVARKDLFSPLPASDGRCVDFHPHGDRLRLALRDAQPMGYSKDPSGESPFDPHCYVADAMEDFVRHKAHWPPEAFHFPGTSTAHCPADWNDFVNIDTDEDSYEAVPAASMFATLKQTPYVRIFSLRPVCTLFPSSDPQRAQTVHGTVECTTLEDLMRYTDPRCDTVFVSNTPDGLSMLTQATADCSPAVFMNPETQVKRGKRVIGFRVPRDQLAESLAEVRGLDGD